MVFGTAQACPASQDEWSERAFSFNEPKSSKAWSLKVQPHCSKGLIMSVQGYVLKHLLFTRRRSRSQTDNKRQVRLDGKLQV